MVKRKVVRTRGKFQLSRYFQDLAEGDHVSISEEKSLPFSFPKRFQGMTGVVEGKRGRSYVVKIKDQNKEKTLLIAPIHLKKIRPSE